MSRHLRRGRLAELLRAGAAGLTTDTAAVGLLTDHHHWLTRSEFTTVFITAATSPVSGQPLAHVRWQAAIATLTAGHLPCTPSEAALLRLAASLAADVPVALGDAVVGLDHASLTAVAEAIMRAGGYR